jgi:hypothetical protein
VVGSSAFAGGRTRVPRRRSTGGGPDGRAAPRRVELRTAHGQVSTLRAAVGSAGANEGLWRGSARSSAFQSSPSVQHRC